MYRVAFATAGSDLPTQLKRKQKKLISWYATTMCQGWISLLPTY